MADELLRDLSLRCGCSHEQRLPCLSCRAVAEIEALRRNFEDMRASFRRSHAAHMACIIKLVDAQRALDEAQGKQVPVYANATLFDMDDDV